MKQSYRIIPTYTADVSGVCSALYELGGMTVMHDPSGCNSTYNTHDEIRWYDMDSLIFISGLTEIDAVMGNDERFITDIVTAANELHPKFIALASSPIPYMNGTDFNAIAKIVQADTGICTFFISTNGMHDYVYGAGLALAEIARHFTDQTIRWQGDKHTVNLLGVTPLDFGPIENVKKMIGLIENNGWHVLSTWAMGDTLETLSKAGSAAVNLVVSSVGLKAAEVLYERFGTPYVIGTPCVIDTPHVIDSSVDTDSYMKQLTDTMQNAVQNRLQQESSEKNSDNQSIYIPYLHNRLVAPATITLIGEPVQMGSLASAIEQKYHQSVRILCPLQMYEHLLCAKDCAVIGEEDIQKQLLNTSIIVADPLYRPVCPKESRFFELPHIAFSGRIYLKQLQKMI